MTLIMICLTFSDEHRQFLADRWKYYPKEQPLFRRLEALVSTSLAVPRDEPDLDAIMDHGQFVDAPIVLFPMRASGCHENTSCLYSCAPDRVQLQTGWALSEDGLWRQHSWGYDTLTHRIIETVSPRVTYYGITFPPDQAAHFADQNMPLHCNCAPLVKKLQRLR